MTSGARKNQANGGWFQYRTEGVMIVNARPLMKPLATSLALYLSTEPSGKRLIQKIHLHPTMF